MVALLPRPSSASGRRCRLRRTRGTLLFAGVLLLLFTVCAGPALAAGGGWARITPGYGKYYKGIDFVDNQNGWLVGEYQVILHTGDGGATWVQQHLNTNNYALSKVQMWSTTRGWAVGNGGAYSGDGAAILATTDGTTWFPQAEPPYIGVLEDLRFVSAIEGWAVGSGSDIIHTTTGGSIWSMQNNGVPTGIDDIWFYGVDFSDSQRGWAVGEDYYGGCYYARIFATASGGASWSSQLPARTSVAGRFYDVDFVDAYNGWAVGENPTLPYGEQAMIYHTSNGSSWTPQAVPSGSDTLYAVHFVDASTGWAVGDDIILATTNGGATWVVESDPNGYNGILTDVDSVDGVTAWASGFGDRVMKRGGGTNPIDAALPLPPSPVHDTLEAANYVDLWSLSLKAGQQIIVTMHPPDGEYFETCLWPPGTQDVSDTSAAVAQSRTYDDIKRFKYIVPAGAGGTYYIEDWSRYSSVSNGAYWFAVNVQSPTTRVTVTAPAVGKYLKAWRTYTYYGTLKPLHFAGDKSVKVVWQKYSGGRWRTDSTMRPENLDYNGYTRFKVSFSINAYGHGTMRWRVQAIHLRDALHPQKASAWRYFSVTN